ncbi:MAG: BMP family ABC transporter substrate-binding protein [Lachnospiraceae bacterium]
MAYEDYIKAQKMGIKAFKEKTSHGEYPYLPVLDEILSMADTEGEVNLGVMNIPLHLVVGTSTAGRTQAFASNFMPLLDYGSEFSAKWSHLVDAQIEEGIHDAIKVYEYLNKYYVIEGNKRASVLKYFDSSDIMAEVIRKVPKYSDDIEIQIYYEYMDFFKLNRINYLQFSKLGSYKKLVEATGYSQTEKWSEDECMDFGSFHTAFYQAYDEVGGYKLRNITCGDALLFFLSLYPYEESKDMMKSEIKSKLNKIWAEIVLLSEENSVELLMDPTEDKKLVDSVLNKIRTSKKKIAFIYDKSPSESNWIYSHELGRLHLEEAFGSDIETSSYILSEIDKDAEDILTEACIDGNEIIFTVTPQLIKASLKIAATYPNVKILNCAPNSSHNTVRTYYTRMYEAKFLTGIVAGALCENNKIGYIADYPIFGVTASINAFALGAKMVNPKASIYLSWSSVKQSDTERLFWNEQINYISAQDMITPNADSKTFGLYSIHNGERTNLAMSIYHWGVFYERLINSIMKGSWKIEEEEIGESKALNYWWGLSAGVIDVICSKRIPAGTSKLIEVMKQAIKSGTYHPFSGPLTDQNGVLRLKENELLRPEEILTMDWLADNVIGSIPSMDDLKDSAKPVVELRGLDTATPDKGGASLL